MFNKFFKLNVVNAKIIFNCVKTVMHKIFVPYAKYKAFMYQNFGTNKNNFDIIISNAKIQLNLILLDKSLINSFNFVSTNKDIKRID